MKRIWVRRILMIFGELAMLIGGLAVWDHIRPREYWFGTEDLEARVKYEEIVRAHGYSYKYTKDVHGETQVVIDHITNAEYKKIDCAFDAWNAQRQRASGVIVYDREDCAL